MTLLRPYQSEAIDAVWDYWADGGGNPLVDMATGTGKSVVIAKLAHRLVTTYPDMRLLMLVHVRELVEQNFMAFRRVWPDAPVGINSAALGRRDRHHRILFASIQSVFRDDAYSLGERHAVLIDEAHLVPPDGGGMYRHLLTKLGDHVPDMRVCGFTATPYRLGSGRLDSGDGALFDETVYSYGIGRGIADGYLAPLVSKRGDIEIDISGVARRGGEFVAGALEAAADVDHVTRSAVREIVERGAGRRSWLIFCTGIKHAFHVCEALRAAGVSCETITGETDKDERRRIIERFRAGHIRAITNANVLTTGFDAPGVDLVAMMRPTLSTGLYVQIVGRGTRTVWPAGFDANSATAEERREAIGASVKPNCLVLDFAGNCRRHGPVDVIEIKPKRKRGDKADPVEAKVTVETVKGKYCPACQGLVAVSAASCPWCEHVFPVEVKHEARADAETPILSAERANAIDEVPVLTWSVARHEKLGGAVSMKVTYFAGVASQHEWVGFEHVGGFRSKAERWWDQHGGVRPYPATTAAAMERFKAGELTRPLRIKLRQNRENPKYKDIVGRVMPPKEDV